MSSSRILAVEGEGAFWDDREAVAACLREEVPRIPPWFGYDEAGSRYFEEITGLPTYYLTRVERSLLERHAAEIAEALGCGRLAEMGSGSAKKTRLLLDACAALRPTTYLPIDVSREMLELSAATLGEAVPSLDVIGLWGRYEAGLDWLRRSPDGPLVVAFLGSNLGNTTPAERDALLGDIAAALRPGDGFLVSIDLVKPGGELVTCYNDPPGHTAFADFRLNHLTHLDRRFGSRLRLEDFVPNAHYEHRDEVVEGHLYATQACTAAIPGLGLTLTLAAGDSINVGFSAKFDRDRFVADVGAKGFTAQAEWTEPDPAYGIFLFRRTGA
ncbi:MAG: L-histidine N(alpha)-methyltransferase [Pseudonocardia sp.]|nr:L-histidine N(alpha)-methyltransferase [Pseudonocardia sp.]